ncbi:MAG TPA: hypothetical protein VG847_00940 [Chitinophagaceae bacterium]|nr:hypothetical protein [Chitinophagaceae bacterium]
MRFYIVVVYDGRRYRYLVIYHGAGPHSEKFEVIGKNKSIFFISNRPLLQAKNLKHWAIKWTVEGRLNNVHYKELIARELEKWIVDTNLK